MTLRARFYSLLISLFTAPFALAGILLGFRSGAWLREVGVFGGAGHSWVALFIDLGFAFVGIYLGGLIAFVVFLFITTTIFSRSRLEHFYAQFPQPAGNSRNILRMPFIAIENFFWSRMR